MNITAPENLQVGFVLGCAAIVFLMQAGFCLLESGMVRSKNSINVAVKNVLDCSLAMLVFTLFGFSMMFGVSIFGVIGDPFSLQYTTDPKLTTFLLFQLVFCSAAATIVSGAIAERAKLFVYLAIVLVLSGFVYPVCGHWVWGGTLPGTQPGWLAAMGFVDWAGGSVVHIVGGFAALAAAQLIGRRSNFNTKSLTGGYSLTMTILGTFLLWFGWWGFNGGSGLVANGHLPKIILGTNIGAVAGGLTAAVYSQLRFRRIEVITLIIGILAGLVSITPACHVLSVQAAFLVGSVGSLVAVLAGQLIRSLKIDDAVGAFEVHGAAGIWGVLAFGLFAPDSALGDNTRLDQIYVQAIGAFAAAAFSYGVVGFSLLVLKQFGSLRVTEEEERLGLNVVEHGATNEITDLLLEINSHGRSGDFSNDIEADAHSEAGQIAKEYNRVIKRVRTEMADNERTNDWLESERLRMKTILDHAGVGIYQLDSTGNLLTANQTLLSLLGYESFEQLAEKQSGLDLPWRRKNESTELVNQRFLDGVAVKELESQVVAENGQEYWVLESLVPVENSSGGVLSWLGTMHNITEQKKASLAEIEIAQAKSEAKGEFLASMSHEIRTPLNGVIGMLDLLDASDLKAKEQNFVSIAKTSAGSLLSLVNDILDFSKIESGHMELEQVEFDIRELLEQTAEQFAYHAHVKQLDMNCQIEDDLPHTLVGDPERLRQIVVNLLSNAIKFTDSGEVNLSASRRGSILRISIQDTGIGMSQQVQDKLFQSFTQADASTTRKYGGTGLGLSISQQLVELMGGQIDVESDPGQGTKFWLEIEMNVAQEMQPSVEETKRLLSHLPQTRVLVIDDNATNCEILANQFDNWGLSVSVCRESTAAVERMIVADRIGKPFDLVILDFCMPEMNGQDVAIAVRKEPALAKVPIIILSSNYELMSQEEMDEVGIHAAITKPARQSRLLDTVMDALFKSQSVEKLPTTAANSNSNNPVLTTNDSPAASPTESANTLPLVVMPQRGVPPVRGDQHDSSRLLDSNTGTSEPIEYAADVLIVEDNYVNRIVAEKMLGEFGLTSDFACDGQAGLEKVKSENYKLILMDGHMPTMDGLTATREIRRWETTTFGENRRVPIIALTANVVQGIRQDCQDAGMDDYLCKPITMATIGRIVDKYLKRNIPATRAVSRIERQPLEAPSKIDSPAPQLPVAGANTSEVADTDDLLSLTNLQQQCCGDEAFAMEILAIMHETLPNQIRQIELATSAADLDGVAGIAHQLKGAAGDSCLNAVYESAGRLELLARNGKSKLAAVSFDELRTRSEATIKLIESLIEADRK